MAEVRKITIEIVEGSGGGDGGGDDEEKKKKKKKKTEEEKFLDAAKHIGQEFLNVIQTNVEQSLQRHFTLTENYMSQNIYNNAKKSISMVMNGAASIASMAKIGGLLGPVGAGFGAVAGAALFIAQQHENYQTRMSSYYQSLNASNYQSDFSQVRAGLIDGSKGTEN